MQILVMRIADNETKKLNCFKHVETKHLKQFYTSETKAYHELGTIDA